MSSSTTVVPETSTTSRLQIIVIDHRGYDYPPLSNLLSVWEVRPGDPPGDSYADFTALYGAWTKILEPPLFIGFFGYRKYLLPHDVGGKYDRVRTWAEPINYNPGWWQCKEDAFNDFREWLAESNGADYLRLLGQYDILKAPPYRLTKGDIVSDFAYSRSMADAVHLGNAMYKMGWRPTKQIHPYLFITRWEVFDRFMRETDEIRKALESQIATLDATSYHYKHRPMAYVMERIFSLWYDHSNLTACELPLLHCWEKQV